METPVESIAIQAFGSKKEALRVLRLLAKEEAVEAERHPLKALVEPVRLGLARVTQTWKDADHARWGYSRKIGLTEAGKRVLDALSKPS